MIQILSIFLFHYFKQQCETLLSIIKLRDFTDYNRHFDVLPMPIRFLVKEVFASRQKIREHI